MSRTCTRPSRDYTELGNGTIDFTRIWPDAKLAGLKYFYVEQGGNFTHDPFRSVADSAEYAEASTSEIASKTGTLNFSFDHPFSRCRSSFTHSWSRGARHNWTKTKQDRQHGHHNKHDESDHNLLSAFSSSRLWHFAELPKS